MRNPNYRPPTPNPYATSRPLATSTPYATSAPYAGANSPRFWTPEDDATLQSMAAAGATTPAIAGALNRSQKAVYSRASILGVTLLPKDPNPYGTWLNASTWQFE